MKEDYLWDKTGEPDPEIQQLEQALGTLRYQPRPLDIPAGLAPDHKRAMTSSAGIPLLLCHDRRRVVEVSIASTPRRDSAFGS